ncbi:MAG: hypothetical protein CSH49_11975 [Alcanivorax sp.]|nr:MAG: hypothetical protein CSH49_11975 [Alcanivorax sp.]
MYLATNGFRLTGATGLAVILLGIVISFFYPSLPGQLPEGFSLSIIALEFSSTLANASSLFEGNLALVHRYQTGHSIDMLYLITYGAFLGFANLSGWYTQRRALSLIGIISAGIAASADFAENLQLMQLTQALLGNGSAPDFWLLRLFVSTKFLMISVSLLCLVPLLWNRGWLGRIFCTSTLLLAPCTLLTLLGNFEFSSPMTGLIMLAWICLLLWALKVRNGLPNTSDGEPEALGTQTS